MPSPLKIICLANSHKYGERCIAGVEVKCNSDGVYKAVKTGARPRWLRPVTKEGFGQVPSLLVRNFDISDVLVVDVSDYSADGFQSENIFFEKRGIRYVSRPALDVAFYDSIIEAESCHLFGNPEHALTIEEIAGIDHSLLFIKPKDVEFYLREKPYFQLRSRFEYFNNTYDLPITDVNFNEKFRRDNELVMNAGHIYFTVSLGIEFNAMHYKLIAGIAWV